MATGEAWHYFPAITVQLNGWELDLRVNLGRSNKFTRYNKLSRSFHSVPDLVETVDIGSHEVKMAAIFTSASNKTVIFRRAFNITVYEQPAEEVVPVLLPPDIQHLPQWDKPIRNVQDSVVDSAEEEEQEDRPVPYVARVTQTGLVTIGWDQAMRPPADFKQIPAEKVALEDLSVFDERDVSDRVEFKWYNVEKDLRGQEAVRLALIDALEVRILREYPDEELTPVIFSYEIVSYSSEYIDLQLDIENPEDIGEDYGRPDRLTVTFWGTEYFESRSGVEVKYGMELEVGIMR